MMTELINVKSGFEKINDWFEAENEYSQKQWKERCATTYSETKWLDQASAKREMNVTQISGSASVKNSRRISNRRTVLSKQPTIEIQEIQNLFSTESDTSTNFSVVFNNSSRSKNMTQSVSKYPA